MMIGSTVAGRYVVERRIGGGGAGQVFLAHDIVLERPVALKLLHSQFTQEPGHVNRILREARLAAKVQHPNIVPVFDAGEWSSQVYITMPYADQGSLGSHLGDTWPLGAGLSLVMQVAEALDYLHQQGIVHRDVKPGNILLGDLGQAQLADFSIARALAGSANFTAMVGTPGYIAPEQWAGNVQDGRVDVFALGRVLRQLLLSRRASRGFDVFEVQAVRSQLQQIAAVVLRATAADPGQRFATARDLRLACGEILLDLRNRNQTGHVPRVWPDDVAPLFAIT